MTGRLTVTHRYQGGPWRQRDAECAWAKYRMIGLLWPNIIIALLDVIIEGLKKNGSIVVVSDTLWVDFQCSRKHCCKQSPNADIRWLTQRKQIVSCNQILQNMRVWLPILWLSWNYRLHSRQWHFRKTLNQTEILEQPIKSNVEFWCYTEPLVIRNWKQSKITFKVRPQRH